MADAFLGRLYLAFWPSVDQKTRIDVLASLMVDWACVAPLFVVCDLLPYGRYSKSSRMITIDARIGWTLQELPAFVIPLYMLLATWWSATSSPPSVTSLVLLAAFVLHYGHRVLVYGLLIRGGKPSPLPFFLLATFFCACNGYMQASFLLHHAAYPGSWMLQWNFVLGVAMFGAGLYANVRCDRMLRGLRRPGETGYKIPRGFLFDYVTGANYLGEALEWAGWALACWSVQGFAFAAFAAAFLTARSYAHHRWYRAHFADYPPRRKVIVPFVF